MFKFKTFAKLCAVAAMAFTIASCVGGSGQPSKNNMVPEGAVMALKVDANTICNKALGEPGSQVRGAFDIAKIYLTASISEIGYESVENVISEFMKDPSSLGLNLDAPLVMSATFDVMSVDDEEFAGDVYLVALLDDAAAFEKAADALFEVAKEEGLTPSKEMLSPRSTYYEFADEDDARLDMALYDRSVVIRLTYDEEMTGNGKESMAALFADRPVYTEGLKAFHASSEDVALYADYDALMDKVMPIIKATDRSTYNQLKSMMHMYEDASCLLTLNFNKGNTVLEAQMYGSKEMLDYGKKYYATSSNKYFDQIPESSFLVVNIALKDLAGALNEFAELDSEIEDVLYELEELGADEEFLAGLPGQITFAIDGDGVDSGYIPDMALFMECDSNVWESLEEVLIYYAEEEDEGCYLVEDLFYVYYENGTIVGMTADMYEDGVYGEFSNSKFASSIAKGGLLIDLNALPESVLSDIADGLDLEDNDLLRLVSSVVIKQDKPTSATVTVNMGDEDYNMLEALMEIIIANAL